MYPEHQYVGSTPASHSTQTASNSSSKCIFNSTKPHWKKPSPVTSGKRHYVRLVHQHNLEKQESEAEVQTIPVIVNGVSSQSVKNYSLKNTNASIDSIHQCIDNLHISINSLNKIAHVSNKLRKIVLIGDSHIKGFANLLQSMLNKKYSLFSLIKPGSNSSILKDSAKEIVKQLSQDDLLVISIGTSDLDNFSKTFQNLRNYLENLNHTNVLLMSIPYRFDYINVIL